VQAAAATKWAGARERSRIERLLENIVPGLGAVDPDLEPTARLAAAVEANVRWSMRQLLELPEAQARAREGVLKLAGAVYELQTGQVRFLS
jgi:carbonic anhydrase